MRLQVNAHFDPVPGHLPPLRHFALCGLRNQSAARNDLYIGLRPFGNKSSSFPDANSSPSKAQFTRSFRCAPVVLNECFIVHAPTIAQDLFESQQLYLIKCVDNPKTGCHNRRVTSIKFAYEIPCAIDFPELQRGAA